MADQVSHRSERNVESKQGAFAILQGKHTRKRKPLLILDSCAILNGFVQNLSGEKEFTTPNVLNEVSEAQLKSPSKLGVIDQKSIEVRIPEESYLKQVSDAVRGAGEAALSDADRSLLALALEFRNLGYDPVLVTDDYALQNMAEILDLDYHAYIERGIRHLYKWKLICPGCHKEYSASSGLATCHICGTALKKRINTSKRVKQSSKQS